MQLREILIIAESPLAREVRHAVAVMDSLHRFPATSPFPLKPSRSRREGGAYNYFMHPSRPRDISISTHTDFPALSLVHEVGHFLDHLALNPIKRGFASEHDPHFDPLRQSWRESKWVQSLSRLLPRYPALPAAMKRLLGHQLHVPEFWARTYTQWVVAKSNDLMLQTCMRNVLNRPVKLGGRSFNFHWENDELAVIITHVDRLFAEAGVI
jgi:hypothetical protein